MFKLFNKKRGKKGFTLAELLVVVAILAILVAVAIPVFTTSLKDAQLRVNLANIRAVKAAGVTYILSNPDASTGDDTYGWEITAKVSQGGQISELAIAAKSKTDWDSGDYVDQIAADTTGSSPSTWAKTNEEMEDVRATGTQVYHIKAYVTDVATPEAVSVSGLSH